MRVNLFSDRSIQFYSTHSGNLREYEFSGQSRESRAFKKLLYYEKSPTLNQSTIFQLQTQLTERETLLSQSPTLLHHFPLSQISGEKKEKQRGEEWEEK